MTYLPLAESVLCLLLLMAACWYLGWCAGKRRGRADVLRERMQATDAAAERLRVRMQPPARDDHWIVDKDGHCRLVDPRRGE